MLLLQSPVNPNSNPKDIANLHILLEELGYLIDKKEKDNKQYGDSTYSAINNFQQSRNMNINGLVDEVTLAALVAAISRLRESIVPQKPSKDPVTLRVAVPPPFKPADFNILRLKPLDARIIGTEKNYIDSKLNQALKQKIIDVFSTAGEKVTKTISELNIDYNKATSLSFHDYLEKEIMPRLEDQGRTVKEIFREINANRDERVKDMLNLEMPLKKNPLFVDEIRVTKINEYAQLGGLKNESIAKLHELKIDPHEFDLLHYEKLVGDKVLTEKEKTDVQLIFEMAKLTDDNLPLMRSLRSATGGSLRDLATWQKSDWLNFFASHNIIAPEGTSTESYADNIVANFEKNFQSVIFLNRAIGQSKDHIKQLDLISPLLQNNPRLFDGKNEEINWKGINKEQKAAMEKALFDLQQLQNSLKYLGIPEILSNEQTTIETKRHLIEQKVNQLEVFSRNNKAADLYLTDFFSKDELKKINWDGVEVNNQSGIKKQLMAYQRTMTLAGDTSTSQMLIAKGFDSADSISSKSFEEFKLLTGMEETEAKIVYAKANETMLFTTHAFESARIAIKDQVGNGLHVSNWDVPDYTNGLKEIDGFDDLFGSQDFCDCEHCRSIFSPAAYFVDLMYFIEKNVSDKVFKTRPNHSLYLKNRRPDLWKLQLTCENTNKLVPYLDIVNQVLEEYLKRALSITDVYNRLHTEQISFRLPFNLYLEELRIYLRHFSTPLYRIFQVLKNSPDEIWRERMSINPEEWQIIHTPDITNNVRKRIGDPSNADFAKFDVKDFLRFAGLTRPQLDQLLNISFTNQLQALLIIKEQSSDPLTDPLINYVERITNLTNERLDFIHRFIRLWRKTGWTIPEFDLILTSLKKTGILPSTPDPSHNGILNKEAIIHCARLLELQEKLKLKTEELPCLYDALPDKAVKDNEQSFFLRSFNKDLLNGASSISFHHSFKNEDGITDSKLGFLLGGLGIEEGELIQLFNLLETEIAFDVAGNTTLDRENISLLYRHTRIAKTLKFSIEELILVLKLLFTPGNQFINSVDMVFDLVEFKRKLQLTRLKIADLWFILKGEEKGAAIYKTPANLVSDMVWNLQLQKTIYFDSNILADIPDVGAENSAKIVEQMVTDGLAVKKSISENLFKLTENYQLNQNFTGVFTAISAPAPVIAKVAEMRAKFAPYHAKNILLQNLSKLLNLTLEAYESLIPFTTVPLDDANMYQALYTAFDDVGNALSPADLKPIEDLVKEFDRLLYLFSKSNLKEEDILFIVANTGVFDITTPTALSFDQLVYMAEYKKLVTANQEKAGLLRTMLVNYQAITNFSDDELVLLAETWKTDKNLIKSVVTFIPLPVNGMEAIMYLSDCLSICKMLGITGDSLIKLKETDFGKLEKARDIITGAFGSKYPDEKERAEKLEPYHDKSNTIKRDALCDFILSHNKELKFKDRNDLYAYFLLDVEMSGCFRTSYLVAANSSLQLYIHRCLMNLEQAAKATIIPDGNTDPDDDAFEFVKVAPALVPADEWEWRKNYRVWEANRKVFLYPENYILPELLDIKTPIFKELEDELLQQKITKESAETAYKKYISQFAELARMKIAGSYYHQPTNTYYLFGRTNIEPGQYYYRQWKDQKTWTAWQKIELAINSTHVSALIYAGKLYLFWTEIVTKEVTSISGGTSSGGVYTHSLYILYSCLDENKKWSSPQKFFFSSRDFGSDLTESEVMNRKDFPGVKDGKLYVFYSDYDFTASLAGHRRIDLFNNKMIGSDFLVIPSDLLMPTNTDLLNLKKSGSSLQLIPVKNTFNRQEARVDDELVVTSSSAPTITSTISEEIYQPELGVVGRKYSDFVFRVGNQQYLVQKSDSSDGLSLYGKIYYMYWPSVWKLIRASTSLPDKLGEKLFMEGLEKFLSLNTQKNTEDVLPFTITDTSYLGAPYYNSKHIDFTGAYGDYYRELFFHIPFLIASHQNANLKFKDADWWYRKIFDVTSADVTTPEKDRNWQYIEFRGLTVPKLQDILTNAAAIEAYKKDPFNPHAIARLRLSAYQKTIVMKYIDNLLDWGDDLFAQDTMESINEATMLYVMAYNILGKRPVKLGKCSTASETALTYEMLGPAIDKGSEFLIQLENYNWSYTLQSAKQNLVSTMAVNQAASKLVNASTAFTNLSMNESVFASDSVVIARETADRVVDRRRDYERVDAYDSIVKEKGRRVSDIVKAKDWDVRPWRPPHAAVVKQKVLAFCIPNNEELLKYWDRVEDRLFKIRNCMNISGVRRQLALFQPPIDPMLLVKAKAAGLSLEDILAAMNKPLPPYRFTYLIEKAKQFTQTIQTFGSALQSALEKKDTEELTLLRSVNEKEILNLTSQVKKQTIQSAQNEQLALASEVDNVQMKIDHYTELIDNGLNGWEVTQQVSRHIGTAFHGVEGVMHLSEAIAYLIPNAGSPFAMTYGGEQFGSSFDGFAEWLGKMAAAADAVSASAGLEATFARREEEWKHQLQLVQQEKIQVAKKNLAAELKVSIAERDLEIHEKNIEHNQELDDFYKNKFTNLGLYNYLATTLTRLYREAYNTAYDVAKMAEQSFQFERDDDTIFIAPDNWQFDKAGLLAGEKLLMQLQRLEKAWLEKHKRDYEISQSFSMQMWAPDKLTELKQKATCTVDIPELVFDLFYPGQYKRIIKSVKLTMPCVAGPYANINCKLSLLDSKVRKEPSAEADVINIPAQKLTSVATSNAQNDSGIFDFNFRDERYLPFEGAGAISSWKLELPNKVRSFDYSSISDVIFTISYTAKDDGAYRETVETDIEAAIADFASGTGLYRLFSLKYEFPEAFFKLISNSTTIQTADIELMKSHFPFIFSAKDILLTNGKVYLKPVKGATITTGGLSVKLNSFTISSWTDFPGGGGVDPDFVLKEGSISMSGNAVKKWSINTGINGLNKDEIDDVIILLKYSI